MPPIFGACARGGSATTRTFSANVAIVAARGAEMSRRCAKNVLVRGSAVGGCQPRRGDADASGHPAHARGIRRRVPAAGGGVQPRPPAPVAQPRAGAAPCRVGRGPATCGSPRRTS